MKELAQPLVSEAAKYGMAILVLVVVLIVAGIAIYALWKVQLKREAQLMEVVKENSLALQENSNAFNNMQRTLELIINKLL